MATRLRSWVHGRSREFNEAWNAALDWKTAVREAEDADTTLPPRPNEVFEFLRREIYTT